MRNISQILIGASLLATSFAVAPAAYAQDDEALFDGAKIGVQAGWERRKIDEPIAGQRIKDSESGIAKGVYAGYDVQMNEVVLGVEAGYFLGGKTLSSPIAVTIPSAGTGRLDIDSKWSADVSARAGVVLGDRVLAYGRVGYGLNRYVVASFPTITGTGTRIASDRAQSNGFLYGGGVEVALSDKFGARVEYRHNNLEGSLKSNQVLAGINFRF